MRSEVPLLICFAIAISTFTFSREMQAQGSREADWMKFAEQGYPFQFSYPKASRIERTTDTGHRYIRVSNDRPKAGDNYSLGKGEYYLEVFFFEHKRGHTVWQPCSAMDFLAKIKKPIGRYMSMRGIDQDNSDAGGIRYAL
jgi:hypothetical protein